MARRAQTVPNPPTAPPPPSAPRRRLGDVEVVADVMQISPRTVWRRVADGTLPKPISLGRAKRWDLDVIDSWIAAHAEPR